MEAIKTARLPGRCRSCRTHRVYPIDVRKYPGIADTKTGKAFLAIAPNKSEENMQKIYDILNYAAFDQPNEANLTAKDLVNDFGGAKVKEAWSRNVETAEKYNDPGTFTTLIGWEWSSNNRGANLHRVVFMPQGGDVANQFIPYSALDSDDLEDLWAWLDSTSEKTGADFVAIPHNPNISLGLMFAETRLNGEPVDAAYARERMKWERNIEITQIKGDSEAHPALSPNDEFADYEVYDFALTPDGARPAPTKADYVRSGLKTGLELEKKVGMNPFKVGFVGSTDSHTGMSSAEETNFGGKGSTTQCQKNEHIQPVSVPLKVGIWEQQDGLAYGQKVILSQSLFDAFQRKEVSCHYRSAYNSASIWRL
ncbi:DUF3604 domain-containing protein [Vibrio sp. M60_M31a]